jgi:integrase
MPEVLGTGGDRALVGFAPVRGSTSAPASLRPTERCVWRAGGKWRDDPPRRYTVRKLHERLGERLEVRVRREHVEDMMVNDLLDLYVLDCEDKGQPIQLGRVEAWREVLGDARAVDVRRDHLDEICRRWQRLRGPTWSAGERQLGDGGVRAWAARDPKRVRRLSGSSCNRYISALRRAYRLGKEKRGLLTALTFPHFKEGKRGEYLTEDQCRAICGNFQAKRGSVVKADVFRLAYLLGVRKGQLRRTCKRHVRIVGDSWKLRWPGEETKNGEPHEVALVGEALTIVQRAWANRLPDCDFLFHIDGRPLGPMWSELERTCRLLGIPYGRGKGIVFHDTRHSAVTNLVGAGVSEAVAMTVTGHVDPKVFKYYNVRRDDVQADALERQEAYLTQKRSTTHTVTALTSGSARQGTTRGA